MIKSDIRQDNKYRGQWLSKCDPWISGGTFTGGWEVKTIFTKILRCYLPLPLSFSHEYTVAFSRGYMTCDDVALIGNGTCVIQ